MPTIVQDNKVLIGIMGISWMAIHTEPIHLLAWKNFLLRYKDSIPADFYFLYSGVRADKVAEALKPFHCIEIQKVQNKVYVGDYLQCVATKMIDENYHACGIIESDAFYMPEDIRRLAEYAGKTTSDWINQTGRGGWLGFSPFPQKGKIDGTFRPWGHCTPSRSALFFTNTGYAKFTESYKDLFGNLDNPLSSETISYKEAHELFQCKEILPDKWKDQAVCLDAWVNANAWAAMYKANLTKATIVNYDGKSMLQKESITWDPESLNKFSSVLDIVDNRPEDIDTPKVVAPCAHTELGRLAGAWTLLSDEKLLYQRGMQEEIVKSFTTISMWTAQFALMEYLIENCTTAQIRNVHEKLVAGKSKGGLLVGKLGALRERIKAFYEPVLINYVTQE